MSSISNEGTSVPDASAVSVATSSSVIQCPVLVARKVQYPSLVMTQHAVHGAGAVTSGTAGVTLCGHDMTCNK